MAHPVDVHVGLRLRELRRAAKMSQAILGQGVGLTFQQVQKYERGVNRISASKLYDISRLLGVPIIAFYEGYVDGIGGGDALASSAGAEAGELLVLMKSIDPVVRSKLLALAKALAFQAGVPHQRAAEAVVEKPVS